MIPHDTTTSLGFTNAASHLGNADKEPGFAMIVFSLAMWGCARWNFTFAGASPLLIHRAVRSRLALVPDPNATLGSVLRRTCLSNAETATWRFSVSPCPGTLLDRPNFGAFGNLDVEQLRFCERFCFPKDTVWSYACGASGCSDLRGYRLPTCVLTPKGYFG